MSQRLLEVLAPLKMGMSLTQSLTDALEKLLVWEAQLGSKLVLTDPDYFLMVLMYSLLF